MNTKTVKLSQVTINEANPRIIRDEKYRKLIDSLLAFPEMLNIRPIVVDNTMTILGGNMRARALYDIATMGVKHYRLHHSVRWANAVPVIVDEQHKKK